MRNIAFILMACMFLGSCVSGNKMRGVQVVGAGSQSCFKSKRKFKKAKAYHYRRQNPTMKVRF